MLMFHDDDCDALLDHEGKCPKCGFVPDLQSTGYKEISEREIIQRLSKGQTMMGSKRRPII